MSEARIYLEECPQGRSLSLALLANACNAREKILILRLVMSFQLVLSTVLCNFCVLLTIKLDTFFAYIFYVIFNIQLICETEINNLSLTCFIVSMNNQPFAV